MLFWKLLTVALYSVTDVENLIIRFDVQSNILVSTVNFNKKLAEYEWLTKLTAYARYAYKYVYTLYPIHVRIYLLLYVL